MKRFVIDIPHVFPKLDIECNDDTVMQYLYNVFSPYTSNLVNEYPGSKRISFQENEIGESYLEIDGEGKKTDINFLRFVERFLLKKSVVDCNYVMLHGGGVAYGDYAFLFLGSSMAGKSTLTAYLCMEGYEYISDDRLLINVEKQTVIPYTKPITLRAEGKEILEKKEQIETLPFRFANVNKELFTPPNCRKDITNISRIFVLVREESGEVRQEQMDNKNKIHELLKHSLSVNDCKNLNKYLQLSKIPMERIHYSEMEDINMMLRRLCR